MELGELSVKNRKTAAKNVLNSKIYRFEKKKVLHSKECWKTFRRKTVINGYYQAIKNRILNQ